MVDLGLLVLPQLKDDLGAHARPDGIGDLEDTEDGRDGAIMGKTKVRLEATDFNSLVHVLHGG